MQVLEAPTRHLLSIDVNAIGTSPRAHATTMSACPLLSRASPLIGALGTSITFGAELDAVEKGPSASAWPAVLQSLLRQQGYPSATVVNGAARGTGADYASLCFDHIWRHPNGSRAEHAPALDLVIIEYTWTSNTAMVEALVQMPVSYTHLTLPTILLV